MGVARHVVNADTDKVRVTTWTFEAAAARETVFVEIELKPEAQPPLGR